MQELKNQGLKTLFKELAALMEVSIAANASYQVKAEETRIANEEAATLEIQQRENRVAFDKKFLEVIGADGKESDTRRKQWNFFIQKLFIFEAVGIEAFQYVDPKYKEYLLSLAKLYLHGHKVLGKKVTDGVNPCSMKALVKTLEEELVKTDGNQKRYKEIQGVLLEIQRRAKKLLAYKLPDRKPTMGDRLLKEVMQNSRRIQHQNPVHPKIA